jgi:hypothetical protein
MGLGGPENRGQGYGLEALALMLNYAFYELNLHRVSLNVIGDNLRAIRAYKKAGFKEEGHIRQAVQRDGQRHDLIWMGILRDEWRQIDHMQWISIDFLCLTYNAALIINVTHRVIIFRRILMAKKTASEPKCRTRTPLFEISRKILLPASAQVLAQDEIETFVNACR